MKFADITGHDAIKETFVRMCDNAHLPNALLLHEDEGCGAALLGLALIQYLNCEDHSGGDSCGVCRSCRQMEKLIHPDVHFVFPVNSSNKISSSEKPTSAVFLPHWRNLFHENPYFLEDDLYKAIGIDNKSGIISVNEARTVLETLSLSPVYDGFRAVFIWLPEKMNAEAANRLLKILEEPPAKTIFCMVTHAPEKVLQTIRSRCRLLRVGPLSSVELSDALGKYGIPEHEIADAVSVAGGSVGTALKYVCGDSDRTVFMEMFGDLMNAVIARDLLTALEIGEDIAALDSREKQKGFCIFVGKCIRSIYMIQNGMEDLAHVPVQERELFRSYAARLGRTFCRNVLEVLDKARNLIDRNVSDKIVFCDLVNRIFLNV